MHALNRHVAMAHRPQVGFVLLIPLLLAALSCGHDPQVGASNIASLVVEGPSMVTPGATVSFKALLRNLTQRTDRDVSQEAVWISSNPAALSIDHGVAKGLANGSATLQVRFEEYTGGKAMMVGSSVQTQLPASAVLVIEKLSIRVFGPNRQGGFGYVPRFLLRETGKISGATIQNILVQGPYGGDNAGPGCWGESLRVPPGGTLDTFYTDEGLKWLGYCAPASEGSTATPQLRMVVSFTDDEQRAGSIEAVATEANQE